MEHLFEQQFTWAEFFFTAFLLLVLYVILNFLERVLDRFTFLGKYQNNVKNFIHYTLLVYEAMVLLILSGVFVYINPPFHGILMLMLLIGGFRQIKNYLSGRIIHFDKNILVGKRLKTESTQGIISNMGRLGLKLRTNKGLHFINYSKLMTDGYMLLSGVEVGGFYQLNINPIEPDEKINYPVQLMDLLTTTPYLDWNHRPQILPSKDNSKSIKARVVVKEESHLHDLIILIQEWGYSVKVA